MLHTKNDFILTQFESILREAPPSSPMYFKEEEVTSPYLGEVSNLLNIYRSHAGNETKMYELQHKIEMLSLTTFSEPDKAYKKYPALMNLLIRPDDVSAKEFILTKKRARVKSKLVLTEEDARVFIRIRSI